MSSTAASIRNQSDYGTFSTNAPKVGSVPTVFFRLTLNPEATIVGMTSLHDSTTNGTVEGIHSGSANQPDDVEASQKLAEALKDTLRRTFFDTFQITQGNKENKTREGLNASYAAIARELPRRKYAYLTHLTAKEMKTAKTTLGYTSTEDDEKKQFSPAGLQVYRTIESSQK